MLICHCNGVTDRRIRHAVREGASTPEDVGRACGAGTCCGGCASAIANLIHTEAAHRSDAAASVAPSHAQTT